MRWTLFALTLFACDGQVGTDTDAATDDTTPAAQSGDCADEAYNPFAGTCAESFWVGCFDPSGACNGTADMLGNVELVWANGASVTSEVDFSDPMNPGAYTEIIASDGTVCATGESTNNVDGCASRTVYTDADGATLTYCFATDGSGTATCDDGTVVAYDADQAGGAQGCQYGDAEACDMDF